MTQNRAMIENVLQIVWQNCCKKKTKICFFLENENFSKIGQSKYFLVIFSEKV